MLSGAYQVPIRFVPARLAWQRTATMQASVFHPIQLQVQHGLHCLYQTNHINYNLPICREEWF